MSNDKENGAAMGTETGLNASAGQRPDDPSKRSEDFSADDRAELTRLREERQKREDAEREAANKAEREKPPVSHYLHLANGETVESAGTMTDYHGVPVIGAYPIEEREVAK
jgi:hypothetical protein